MSFELPVTPVLPFSETAKWSRRLGFITVILSLAAGVGTVFALTGPTETTPTRSVVIGVLLGDAVFILALFGFIGFEIRRIRRARWDGLPIRPMIAFGLVAMIPMMTGLAIGSRVLGQIDHGFSNPLKEIVEDSVGVAANYLKEHGRVIRGDMIAMAADLERASGMFERDQTSFANLMTSQAVLRLLPQASLVQGNGTVILSARPPDNIGYVMPPKHALEKAEGGGAVVIGPGDAARVAGLIKLKTLENTYLFVSRSVDPSVLAHLRGAEAGLARYRTLEARFPDVWIGFATVYLCVTLMLLASAIWVGLVTNVPLRGIYRKT